MKDLIICHPQGARMSDLEFDENLLEPLAGHPLSSPEQAMTARNLQRGSLKEWESGLDLIS